MEIFKFRTSGADATILDQGEVINGLTSVLWVERYREAGEFTLTAPATSDIKAKLPLGTFISHMNTYEVMVVENHAVKEDENGTQEISITGRTMEVILEQRGIGSNMVRVDPPVDQLVEYALTASDTWVQGIELIADHIDPDNLIDDNNQFFNIEATYDVGGLTTPFEYDPTVLPWYADATEPAGSGSNYRAFKRGDVYSALMELLAVDDLGIKTIRPGPWVLPGPIGLPGPWTATVFGPTTAFVIHNGKNRSHKIIFSYQNGEIESAEYLWSNKKLKTHALVQGKWVERLVGDVGVTGYDRRVMYVDGAFIDESFDVAPAGADLTAIKDSMDVYGAMLLAAQTNVSLIKVEVKKTPSNLAYRTDYNIGDIVRIEGNYETVSLARVVEYVEVYNQAGESGYPTLSLDYQPL